MSVSDITPPAQVFLTDSELITYRSALGWLMNYTAANIPAPSSIVQNFWSSSRELSAGPNSYGALGQNFQSILSFPIWLFNANNYGNTDLLESQVIQTLPTRFYTQASLVAPYSNIQFDPAMFIVFVTLQGLALGFVWLVLLWAWFFIRDLPVISSYPDFDGMFKMKIDMEPLQDNMWNSDDQHIRRKMKYAKVYRTREEVYPDLESLRQGTFVHVEDTIDRRDTKSEWKKEKR
jgi:hypothetical protein